MKQIKKRGFTLVELVIVIAVIAILAAVLIPTFITVIDNANNSADTQLVRNMNSVLSTEVYADETATAENLRKLLKENGLEAEALQTKKSENIIVYNQSKNRFEKINLSKANILTEGEAKGITSTSKTGNRITAHADDGENALIIDPNPFSFAEIFEGYTIVSTGGNSLAEAVYGFYNLPESALQTAKQLFNAFQNVWDKVCDIKIDKKEYIIAGFCKLVNKSVFINTSVVGNIPWVTETIVLIKETNQMQVVVKAKKYEDDKAGSGGFTYQDSNGSYVSSMGSAEHLSQLKSLATEDREITGKDFQTVAVAPASVVISEATVQKLYLNIFNDFSSAVVVIPNTVESVVLPEAGSNLRNIMFLGNTEVLGETELYGAQMGSMRIQDVKKNVQEFGAAVAQSEFYVSSLENDKSKLNYYPDLQTALNKAEKSAEAARLPREVILASDYTITTNTKITIPANVTLHVPYSLAGDLFANTGEGEGTETTLVDDDLKTKNASGYTKGNYKQCTLTVESGASIAVEGNLVVGAQLSKNLIKACVLPEGDIGYISCVSGNYGQITNKGNIIVENGGELDAYGYIKCEEDGVVTVKNGATAYEPIVITDGTNVITIKDLLENRRFPFMRYALPNITKLKIEYGGLLSVLDLTVMKDIIETLGGGATGEGYFVGGDTSNEMGGLITLCRGESGKNDGSVLIEYAYKSAVKDSADTEGKNNLVGDIGINTVTLNGNVETGIVMNLRPDLQKEILSYIPYNFEYVIAENCTFTVKNNYAMLPGAKVTVKNGGKLSVASGGAFYVVDSYNADGSLKLDGKSYPTPDMLTKAELPTSAVFTLESGATFEVQSGAHVGGTIQAASGAKITVASGANLEGSFTIGADLSTDEEAPNSNKQDYTGENALPLKYKKNGEESETSVTAPETDETTITVS